jgi:mitochondrial distribution and morphology protein 34
MAFHFNWSPLIADTDRVRHMLTSSLNKSPKPPIIVDDILVNELNLGSNPPSLEILEIGDLAEDRFRGIFKVKYEGDAYLTLQTRVQANPLNTFLSTKPSFASPCPLAAGSGLTIPLQITLSDIRLSGFVILVFSKQKGITLVFRNDPLESLKVSSTFDSIPFVRDYLQRTIEAQLRILFMEDLPAIIHRLSLRVFSEEHQPRDGAARHPELDQDGQEVLQSDQEGSNVGRAEPYESTSQLGTDDDAVAGLSSPLDPSGDAYASFSHRNLVRLAALTESQRTLSLFTPNIRDAVYRAWASAAERDANSHASPLHHRGHLATLSRINSSANIHHQLQRAPNPSSGDAMSSAASHISDAVSHATRPSLASHSYTSTSYTLSSGRSKTHATRKRRNRIVNLRRNTDNHTDGASETMSLGSAYDDTASKSESMSASGEGSSSAGLEMNSTVPTSSSIHRGHQTAYEGEVITPHTSPRKKADLRRRSINKDVEHLEDVVAGAEASQGKQPRRPVTPKHQTQPLAPPHGDFDADPTPRQSMYLPHDAKDVPGPSSRLQPRRQRTAPTIPNLPRTSSELSISDLLPSYPFAQEGQNNSGSSGGILEQAWMMKMATEIARRVAAEREKQQDGVSSSRQRQAQAEQLLRERERGEDMLRVSPAL